MEKKGTKTNNKKTTTAKKTTNVKKVEMEVKEPVVVEEIKEEKKDIKLEEVKPTSKSRKGIIIILLTVLLILAALPSCYSIFFKNHNNSKKVVPKINDKLPKLPKPEVTEGERGLLGIDKNINEKTIDKYLNRDDSVYRDMRMLEDYADYENIGGDSYLSGYIKGFEVVPLPYIFPVRGLPSEVGNTYAGETLFFKMSDGTYVPNYEESMDIIEELFPKDKVIFLMCGGGGYAGMMKEFLVSQGWNADYIYVVGGYWYYRGKNDIKVPKVTNKYGAPVYDFSEVPYHDIDFSNYTEILPDRHNKGEVEPFYLEDQYYGGKDEEFDKLVEKFDNAYDDYEKTHKKYDDSEYNKFYNERLDNVSNYINKLMQDKKSFIITVKEDDTCGDSVEDDTIRTKALDFLNENNIYTYDISSDILIKTDAYKDVKYGPNCIIIKKGKVYTFYDDESDEDLKITESKKATADWIQKYIKLK